MNELKPLSERLQHAVIQTPGVLDEPHACSIEQRQHDMLALLRMADAPPQHIYAYQATGLFPILVFLSPETTPEYQEYRAAVQHYFELKRQHTGSQT